MKKKIAPKMQLHRDTLLRLDPEPLDRVRGGVVTVGRACEPTSNCSATLQCSVTACGHC
jgi:hypothetical protein